MGPVLCTIFKKFKVRKNNKRQKWKKRNVLLWDNLYIFKYIEQCWFQKMQDSYYLILVSSSSSLLSQSWSQPEKANMSISYLRWSARKGRFSLKTLTIILPSSSIWVVNLRALKFTRHRSFWISAGSPLFASLASVLFRCMTLCFSNRGRTCLSS